MPRNQANKALDAEPQKQIVSFDYKRTALEFNLIGSDEVVRSFNQADATFLSGGGAKNTKVAIKTHVKC
ncbi:MAG: hypothetical protein PHC78_00385 [Verrucomicrobiota bacterium]|nr:hypothetical protein [Verrucomicrobiota bacterium]